MSSLGLIQKVQRDKMNKEPMHSALKKRYKEQHPLGRTRSVISSI